MAASRQDIIDYYDKTEISYRLWWDLNHSMGMHFGYSDHKAKTFRESVLRFNEVLAEEAAIGEGDHVLDAGCGVGGSSIYLAENYGCNVVGATICPMIRPARSKTSAIVSMVISQAGSSDLMLSLMLPMDPATKIKVYIDAAIVI